MPQRIANRNRLWRVMIISPMVLAVAMTTSGATNQAPVETSASSLSSTVNSTAVPLQSTVQLQAMTRSTPIRLMIPTIGLDSRLMKLGLQKDGSLQVPPSGFPAGWYTGSPTPGQIGPAVIAGHIDWNGPGVFYHLNQIRLGDQIFIYRADETVASFKVTRIAAFLKSQFPTEAVYGNLTYPGLRLITCGDYDFKLHRYVRDLVVFGTLIQ